MNGNFDIQSIDKPTNKDINITFSPSTSVASYTYQIYKDNIPTNKILISNNEPATITLKETGTYQIEVQMRLLNGYTDTLNSGKYIIDKTAEL